LLTSYALGGPNQHRGGSMATGHDGMNLQPEHFDAIIKPLRAALAHLVEDPGRYRFIHLQSGIVARRPPVQLNQVVCTGSASCRTVRHKTSAPSPQSSGELYSAGLWLTPSRERTKIIPTGQRSTSCMQSWPAPLGNVWGGRPISRQARVAASWISGEQGTGAIRCNVSIARAIPRLPQIYSAR